MYNCNICDKEGLEEFCPKDKDKLDKGWILNGWRKEGNEYVFKREKNFDETDKRLDRAVREGRASGKSLNKIRSFKVKDGWDYKHIK
jgi:hypothetical protein